MYAIRQHDPVGGYSHHTWGCSFGQSDEEWGSPNALHDDAGLSDMVGLALYELTESNAYESDDASAFSSIDPQQLHFPQEHEDSDSENDSESHPDDASYQVNGAEEHIGSPDHTSFGGPSLQDFAAECLHMSDPASYLDDFSSLLPANNYMDDDDDDDDCSSLGGPPSDEEQDYDVDGEIDAVESFRPWDEELTYNNRELQDQQENDTTIQDNQLSLNWSDPDALNDVGLDIAYSEEGIDSYTSHLVSMLKLSPDEQTFWNSCVADNETNDNECSTSHINKLLQASLLANSKINRKLDPSKVDILDHMSAVVSQDDVDNDQGGGTEEVHEDFNSPTQHDMPSIRRLGLKSSDDDAIFHLDSSQSKLESMPNHGVLNLSGFTKLQSRIAYRPSQNLATLLSHLPYLPDLHLFPDEDSSGEEEDNRHLPTGLPMSTYLQLTQAIPLSSSPSFAETPPKKAEIRTVNTSSPQKPKSLPQVVTPSVYNRNARNPFKRSRIDCLVDLVPP